MSCSVCTVWCPSCCGIKVSRRSSSSFRSCNLLAFFIRWSRSKVKCLKYMSCSEQTRDNVTKESPTADSLFPISIFAFGRVSPWLLCAVMAHAKHIGTWTLEQGAPFFPSHERFMGTIGTTFTPSEVVMVSPLYASKFTNTAVGSEGGPCSSNRISWIVPKAPLTNPASVYIFAINITREPFASNNSASSPLATSEVAFLASRPPICSARILATGRFKDRSVSKLILSTSFHVVSIETASENCSRSTWSSFPSNHWFSLCQSFRLLSLSCNLKSMSQNACCSSPSPDCCCTTSSL